LISLRKTNLFRQILVEPYLTGRAEELIVVAGYASPRMLAQHLQAINEAEKTGKFKIRLVVGMTGGANLSAAAISAFIGLMIDNSRFSSQVYTPKGATNIHSKLYVWLRDGEPIEAWTGSANYSRLAFGLSADSDNRDELMVKSDPEPSLAYALGILDNSELLTDDIPRANAGPTEEVEEIGRAPSFVLPEELARERYALCPLVNSRTRQIHNPGAGLNWGQPTESRSRSDIDAAYIPVPSEFRDFFPPAGELFEAHCPDGQVLVLTRSQQGGKALSTPASNETLGQYFRAVLGVENGKPVETDDLKRFGSNCVVFEKAVGQSFYLHFYPGLNLDELEARLQP